MLTLTNVDAGYGTFQALFGATLEVNAGEAVAVIGPNGAGKTTLMRVISGLIPARAGQMVMEGTDLTATPPHQIIELGVAHVVLGCRDKVAAMDELAASLGIEVRDCAYVGDDIPDLALLEHVGFSVAVANAMQSVQERCHYITRRPGGAGAVREVCDLVVAASGR